MRMTNLVITSSIAIFLLGGAIVLLLWLLHPEWWKKRYVRLPVLFLPLAAVSSVAIWALGHSYRLPALAGFGSHLTPVFVILQMSLLISLPVSAIFYSTGRIVERIEGRGQAFSPKRRRLFKTLAAAFPAAAMPSGMVGVAESYSGVKVPMRAVPVTDLPPELEGFKIAHLSDIHLGIYVHLDDLRGAIEGIKPHAPDLVLVTGDIADDLSILPEALEIINQLTPRYGTFASVGNHEYYRGIREVLSIFEAGPFPILMERHTNIAVGGATIALGGADDPVTLRRDHTLFLSNTIEKTLERAPESSFKILMSHRPEGFNYAAEKGINLVLSGHTHGGQIGFGGRSLLESVFPEKYLWGLYRRGRTTLFTSGGMGHWMPFRLGVPAEAPILILERG